MIGALILDLFWAGFIQWTAVTDTAVEIYYQLTHVASIAELIVVLRLLIRYHTKLSKKLTSLGCLYTCRIFYTSCEP